MKFEDIKLQRGQMKKACCPERFGAIAPHFKGRRSITVAELIDCPEATATDVIFAAWFSRKIGSAMNEFSDWLSSQIYGELGWVDAVFRAGKEEIAPGQPGFEAAKQFVRDTYFGKEVPG